MLIEEQMESSSFYKKLDANESYISNMLDDNDMKGIISSVARYPDREYTGLKKSIAEKFKLNYENISLGTGSDELIKLVMEVFCSYRDKLLIPSPSFSEYDKIAVITKNIPVFYVSDNYEYSAEDLIEMLSKDSYRMIFICNPNNPTGFAYSKDEIVKILDNYSGLVIVDEAYYEFNKVTCVDLINKYENLIVLRTLSKAWGMAGLRIGYSVSSSVNTQKMESARLPYNIALVSAEIAKILLKKDNTYIEDIILERGRILEELKGINDIKVYDSKANFVLIDFKEYFNEISKVFNTKNIRTRSFDNELLTNHIRITLSKPEINDTILNIIKEICND